MKKASAGSVSVASILDALSDVPLPSDEAQSFAASLLEPHPSVLRVKRGIDPADLEFATEPVAWYALAHRLCDSSIKPSRSLAYPCGDYYLQDAGSLLALAACRADQHNQDSTLLICDLCAAPGGKASGLLETLGDGGFLLANEPIRSRVASLSYNLARTGSDRFAVTSFDPDALAERLVGVFDLVLVDAPCSGQALMGRGRQSAAALSERQVNHSAARQRRILSAATRLLRPGGQLVYSTCTFTAAENEQQVAVLRDQGIVEPRLVESLESYRSGDHPGCYRLWPHRHECAGSFAASMTLTYQDHQHHKRSWKRRQGDKTPADLSQWFEWDGQMSRIKTKDAVVFGWPVEAPDWVDDLAVAGPELLHRTGQTWKPSHAAALRSVDRGRSRRFLDVDGPTAQKFLSGQGISSNSDGWQVVRYRQRPLGWIKASHSKGKNQLPTAARMNGPWLSG